MKECSRISALLIVLTMLAACVPQTAPTWKSGTSPSASSAKTSPPEQTTKVYPVSRKSTTEAAGSVFHAVIMVDTLDEQIGKMVSVDLKRMRKQVQKMATLSGLRLAVREFIASEFRGPKVQAYIDSLNVGSDDVLFFYYSGHGFRYENQKAVWPYFDMNKPLAMEGMIKRLRGKKARLMLALSDACNNVLEGVHEPQMAFRSAGLGGRGYRTLFRKYKGEVIATSSSPGETSQTTSYGSWFTRDFLMGIDLETSTRTPDWRDVMEVAGRKKSETYNGVVFSQTPHTVVRVTPIGMN